MKPKFRSLIAAFSPSSRTSFIFCASLCAAASVQADQIWTGGTSTDWNTSTNWNPATIPGVADIAIFDATSIANLATTSSTSFSVKGLQVTSPSAAVSIALPLVNKVTNIALTVNFTTDVFTYAPGTPLANGDVVTIGGTTPTGIVGGLPYFVVNATATTFQISLTQGGAAVDFTTIGTTVTATGGTFNSLTTGTSGIDLSLATQNLTISAPLSVATSQSWNVATGMTLNTTGYVVGAGTITKSGVGLLILGGSDNLSGGISVTGGQLTARNGLALGPNTNTLTLGNGTHFRYETLNGASNGTSIFVGNPISLASAASVTITTVSTASGYSGVITGDAASTVTIGAAGLLTQCSFGNNANTQQFSGVGTVKIYDGASIRFSATSGVNNGGVSSTFDVGIGSDITTRNSGTVNLGALTGVGSVTGSAGANGTGIFSVGAKAIDSTYAGIIKDGATGTRFAALTKVGAAKLTLTGANTYTGATLVNVGTLEVGDGTAAGSIGATNVTVAAAANLNFNTSGTQTVTGIIAGAGNVKKQGSGRTTFAGVNTFTVGPVIEGGSLAINADSGLGNAANTVSFTTGSGKLASDAAGLVTARAMSVSAGATGGFTAIDATDSLEVTGVVSGNGALEVGGGLGLVRLAAANTYVGNTTVTGGILDVGISGATSTGSVSVTGGTLAGTGAISGAVSVAAAASIKPGAVTTTTSSTGTLPTGQLTLAGGSTIYEEFTNSTTYDTIAVTGNLLTSAASLGNPILVDLRLQNSAAKWATLGSYKLISYTGTFTGSANDLFEVTPASTQSGVTYTFDTTTFPGFITLKLTGTPPSEWNVDADGTWATAGNWAGGVPNGSSITAVFGTVITAPHNVTLAAPATVGAVLFNNANAYSVIGASTLTMNTTSGNAGISLLLGSHVISAPLSLAKTTDLSLASAGETLTLSGIVSGIGGLNNATAGTVVLSGANTFSGTVNFSGGTLAFGNGSLGTGSLILANSTLRWNAGNTQDISNRAITIGATAVTFDTDTNNVLLANAIGNSGTGNFIKTGAGVLTLGANATFSGTTTISGGTLKLGTGGSTGLVTGDITDNATLSVNLTTGTVFNTLVVGSGAFIHSGTGVLELGAQNTFTGTTSISSPTGSLLLADGLNIQNSTLEYAAGGGSISFGSLTAPTFGGLSGDKSLVLDNITPAAVALTIGNNSQATTYSGALTGTGSLIKIGTGISILTGTNTYAGTTTINAGDLELAGGSLAGVSLSTGGTGRSVISGGVLSTGTGTFAVGSNGLLVSSGSATFSGAVNAVGGTGGPSSALVKVTGGTLSMVSLALGRTGVNNSTEPAAGAADNNLYITGGDVSISGALQIGTASSQPNSTVTTRMDGGTLTVGGAITVGLNNTGRWSVLDLNGGALTSTDAASGIVLGGPFAGQSIFLVRAGVGIAERISFGQGAVGGNAVIKIDGGELYLGTGGIVLGSTGGLTSEIRLVSGILGAKADWSTTLPVNVAGTTTIKAANSDGIPHNIALGGVLSGIGGLTKDGTGKLSLTAANSYTGNTIVNFGTFEVLGNNSGATGSVQVESSATLAGNGNLGGDVTIKTGGRHALAVAATPGTQATRLIAGILTLEGGDFLDLTSAGPVADGTYTLATAAGGITGSLLTTTVTLSGGVAGTVSVVGNDLRLTVSGSAYGTWASSFGLQNPWLGINPALNGTPAADPDNDGIANELEFALGGNPTLSSTNVLPTLVVNATNFIFTFNRVDASEAEVGLQFQYGTTLTAWTPVVIGVDTASSGPGVVVTENAAASDTIQVTIAKGANTKLFGRLRAVK